MNEEITKYYELQPEPQRGCLLGMRDIILRHHPDIAEVWKYRMPMFTCKGKMFCYLWTKRKDRQPYLGIVEGRLVTDPDMIQEKRARMKILLPNPARDLPVRKIKRILTEAMNF